ncbi:MAG: lipid-A-disaccharide synthase [Planctomycetaceae bacterium]|nr:MAG: lipid-A-disaccharide synthase [Planctomycetaceae bacterium]
MGTSRGKTLFLSVGEPSGDQHAGRLIRELRRHDGNLRFRGFGGPVMSEAGCEIDHDLTRLAVVGLVEVLPKLREFFRLADAAEELFRRGDVDGVLLVDFPGFNWHIAKRAKKYGLPVHYYLPPQLWAWGGWRVRKLRRSVDHVMSVLRLEQRWYDEHQVPNTYVGHPFFDAVAEQPLDDRLLERLTPEPGRGQRSVAVLPGSRDHEVHQNFPLMLDAMRRIAARHPDVRFLLGAHRDAHALWCRDRLHEQDRGLPVEIFVGRTSEVIEACECAMMVSGSVSLELLARGKPAAVIYRVGRILHTYARLMVNVKSITLVNLMAGRAIFPEMVSVGRPEPGIEFLERSVCAMLEDRFYYDSLVEQLAELRASQGSPGGIARAAAVLLDQFGWTGLDRPQLESVTDGQRKAAA